MLLKPSQKILSSQKTDTEQSSHVKIHATKFVVLITTAQVNSTGYRVVVAFVQQEP